MFVFPDWRLANSDWLLPMIRPQTCPVCHLELSDDKDASRYFPFCSQRCRQVDIYRWCTGKYAIVEPIDPNQLDNPDQEIVEGG